MMDTVTGDACVICSAWFAAERAECRSEYFDSDYAVCRFRASVVFAKWSSGGASPSSATQERIRGLCGRRTRGATQVAAFAQAWPSASTGDPEQRSEARPARDWVADRDDPKSWEETEEAPSEGLRIR
jgi:hypothetical protein